MIWGNWQLMVAAPAKGKRCLAGALAGLALGWAQVSWAEDAVVGEEIARIYGCLECHAADGRTISQEYPRLAGQRLGYLLKQLRDFQSGARRHQIMNRMTDGIPDEALVEIAAFFGSRPPLAQYAVDARPQGAGRTLFEQGNASRQLPACASCHGADGNGGTDGAGGTPAIGGQHRFYLRGQLLDWKNGARTNSEGGVMNVVAAGLSMAEIEALAEYLGGR